MMHVLNYIIFIALDLSNLYAYDSLTIVHSIFLVETINLFIIIANITLLQILIKIKYQFFFDESVALESVVRSCQLY